MTVERHLSVLSEHRVSVWIKIYERLQQPDMKKRDVIDRAGLEFLGSPTKRWKKS